MFSSSFLAVVLAGAAIAFTPSGFTPSSNQNLTVAFGNTLAIDGKEIQKAETANAPTIGTSERLTGTYAIMMVDPDVPSGPSGTTTELLHWMQAGLVSANKSSLIGGVETFELINIRNTAAYATYIQPSPPNKVPNTHRYTQLLLNTTGSNATSLTTLAKLAMTRTNFNAVNAISMSGVQLVAGNSFDVTNGTSNLIQSNITKTMSQPAGAVGTGTGSGSGMESGMGSGSGSGSGAGSKGSQAPSGTLIQSNITKTTSRPAGAVGTGTGSGMASGMGSGMGSGMESGMESGSGSGTGSKGSQAPSGTLIQSNITKTTSRPAGAVGTGSGSGSAAGEASNGTLSNGTPKVTSTAGAAELKSSGAWIAGFGALAAAVLML